MVQGEIAASAEKKWQELLAANESALQIKNILEYLKEHMLDTLTVDQLWKTASKLKSQCWSISNVVSYWNLTANDAYAYKKLWKASEHYRLTRALDKPLKANQADDDVEIGAYSIVKDELEARYIADQFNNLYSEANSYISLIQSMVNTKKRELSQQEQR